MHRAQLPRAQARRGDPKDPGSIAYEGTHNHEPPTGSNRGKKRKSVDQNSKPPLSPNSKAMKMKPTKKSSSHRSSELQNVTPRFWERAEALAMETLGSLSPGSRKRAAKLTSSRNKRKSGNGLAVQVPDLISGGAPTSITPPSSASTAATSPTSAATSPTSAASPTWRFPLCPNGQHPRLAPFQEERRRVGQGRQRGAQVG